MIEYPNIDPVAISIPISGFWGESINIYWYGLAYVVGAYLIYLRMLQTRSKFNIQMEKNDAEDLVIVYGLLCAVIGGRQAFLIFTYNSGSSLFLKYIKNMSFHGGVISSCVWIFAYRGISFNSPFVPQFLLPYFLAECNYQCGTICRPTDVSWGMIFSSRVRHPSQL